MATLAQRKARAAFAISGNSPKVQYFREGISQSFKKGALLYLTASGTCKVMVAQNTPGTGFDTLRKRILGIALKDASNSTSPTTDIPVHLADGDTVFVANAISRTSAATSSLAVANVGKAVCCSGVMASQVYVELNPAAATNTIARIIGFVDEVGDLYGRVLFQFLPGARAFA